MEFDYMPEPDMVSDLREVADMEKAKERYIEEREHAESLSDSDIEDIILDYSNAETADGCMVEPDGVCPHGYRSPLLILGLI